MKYNPFRVRVLLYLGGVFTIIKWTILFTMPLYIPELNIPVYINGHLVMDTATCGIIMLRWFVAWGIVLILSGKWITTGNRDKAREGCTYGIISSMFSVSLLGIIGVILGCILKTPEQ